MTPLEKSLMQSGVNFIALASSYAGFLAALGGVSITVLTLVLALEREPSDPKHHSLLIASLVVATISCFVGTHLMAETAAFTYIPPAPPNPLFAARLFLIASVNIYLAVDSFLFSLMLLPAAYGKRNAAHIRRPTTFAFVTLQLGAFVWVGRSVLFHLMAPVGAYLLALVASLCLALCFFFTTNAGQTRCKEVPFLMAVLFTIASLIFFAFTFNDGSQPKKIDVIFYSLATTLPCASLVGLGVKAIWASRTTSASP
jgi:hypothetical protein